MLCPRCSSEYVEGIARCEECGVELVESLAEKPATATRDLSTEESPEQSPVDDPPGIHDLSGGDRYLPLGDRFPPDDLDDRVEVRLPGDPRGHAMRRVHVARTLEEAHAVKDTLEGAGFACVVHEQHPPGSEDDGGGAESDDGEDDGGGAESDDGEDDGGGAESDDGEDDGAEVPVDPDTLPSVWVPESQAERAIRLVALTQGGASEEGDWTCPQCGEDIEGQFTDCWQCGTAHP
jgi:hypothetical protein